MVPLGVEAVNRERLLEDEMKMNHDFRKIQSFMYHWAQKGRSRASRRSGESISNPDFLAFEKAI